MLPLRFASDAPPIQVELWNGELLSSARDAIGRVLIKTRRAFAEIRREPSLGFARGYAQGEIEIQGDLVGTLCAVLKSYLAWKTPRLVSKLARSLSPNTIRRARENVMAHYDLGNDFFSLWLDETMLYSGAIFRAEGIPLSQAQEAKCDLICRKLDLRAGQRFLDIGCGWGYLCVYAAQKYGVHSVGITLSPRQHGYGNARAARLGLADRCRIELRDYRQITGSYDAIASVGMLEHVGRPYLKEFFQAVAGALRPGGRCVIQNIGQQHPAPISDFANAVFPGGYLPTGAEILQHAAEAGLEIRHLDTLGEHYVLTLRQWRKNFQAARAQIERLKGMQFTRWWELYLALSEAAFRVGRIQLFQTMLTKGHTMLPLTRGFAAI